MGERRDYTYLTFDDSVTRQSADTDPAGFVDGLLETFVFRELRRQASWHEDTLSFFHFRNRDDYEVPWVKPTAPSSRFFRIL